MRLATRKLWIIRPIRVSLAIFLIAFAFLSWSAFPTPTPLSPQTVQCEVDDCLTKVKQDGDSALPAGFGDSLDSEVSIPIAISGSWLQKSTA